jgi:hypothetical protein
MNALRRALPSKHSLTLFSTAAAFGALATLVTALPAPDFVLIQMNQRFQDTDAATRFRDLVQAERADRNANPSVIEAYALASLANRHVLVDGEAPGVPAPVDEDVVHVATSR